MWQEVKKKELRERKLVRDLYRDLIEQVIMNERSKKVSFVSILKIPTLDLN